MMAEYGNERRNFCRLDTCLQVLYGKQAANFSGVIDALGFGGARIRSPRTFPKDTTFILEIPVPNQPDRFAAQARVAWVQEMDSMGIEFLNLARKEILLLEKLLAPADSIANDASIWD